VTEGVERMSINGVMFQYFEWYLENDGTLWNKLKEDAPHLKEIGITSVWIPPCYKGTNSNDTGYGVYDVYDLGEFDQKGTVRTKYGTKKELLEAIEALHQNDLRVYADIAINHKAGADGTERFMAIEVDQHDRTTPVSDPYEIEGWVKFDFNGRNNQYSDFKWSWEHFNGTDFNNENGKKAIYLILGENKNWAEGVSNEFGNYDYLMFSNVDYKHPEVQNETFKWITWFIRETNVDGIRLDAIKHINDWFMKDLLNVVHAEFGDDFYCVGEYWETSKFVIDGYLKEIEYQTDLFDVALHYKFYEASRRGNQFDMRTVFNDTIVKDHPTTAVTFVNNHDSQLGQSLESNVAIWYRPLAYGLILLRKDGNPCVFYGDYYGLTRGNPAPPIREDIDKLLELRQKYNYGDQEDYFDHQNVIGWVRLGNEDHPRGCAVIMTNGDPGEKTMQVGQMHSGETWTDKMGNVEDPVVIDEQGNGIFKTAGGSISVYAIEEL
jgi:alpha-amylase